MILLVFFFLPDFSIEAGNGSLSSHELAGVNTRPDVDLCGVGEADGRISEELTVLSGLDNIDCDVILLVSDEGAREKVLEPRLRALLLPLGSSARPCNGSVSSAALTLTRMRCRRSSGVGNTTPLEKIGSVTMTLSQCFFIKSTIASCCSAPQWTSSETMRGYGEL